MDASAKQRLLQILQKDRVLIRVSADLIFFITRRSSGCVNARTAQGGSNRINVDNSKNSTGITASMRSPS